MYHMSSLFRFLVLFSTSLQPHHHKMSSFMSLPYEIRYQIWRLSLIPRVVEIHCWSLNYGSIPINPGPVPILYVCHDARGAVIDLYPCLFGTAHGLAETRFNGRLDTLYLGPSMRRYEPRFSNDLKEHDRAAIQRLAVNLLVLGGGTSFTRSMINLNFFPNLKELIVIREDMWQPNNRTGRGSGSTRKDLEFYDDTKPPDELLEIESELARQPWRTDFECPIGPRISHVKESRMCGWRRNNATGCLAS